VTLPLGLLFRYTYLMAKSIKVHPKKRRGRPATGKDPLVSARLPQTLIDQVEHWAGSNEASRSEAIRRLVELGLEVKAVRPVSKLGRRLRAQDLATKAIEMIFDPSAPPEERAQRRRRLTKGPAEFREDRVDLPKAKGK
jgi:Arc/MetJ-type ribon-helix-helix transcriptional regulator